MRIPRALVLALAYIADRSELDADKLLKEISRLPDWEEAVQMLVPIAGNLNGLCDVEILLRKTLGYAPASVLGRYYYALVLNSARQHARAYEQLEILLANDPNNPAYRTLYGNVCVGINRYDEALNVIADLVKQFPLNPDYNLSLGHVRKIVGKRDEAIASYRSARNIRPDFGDAYWSLANLKTYRFNSDEVIRMRTYADRNTGSLIDRYSFCFALGKAYEDLGAYHDSFFYYNRGNALKMQESGCNLESLDVALRARIAACSKDFFLSRRAYGCPLPDPIFIVGLPRSGSTLLQQILAAHSHIEGTGELAEIHRIGLKLCDHKPLARNYPALLAELTSHHSRELGEQFILDTKVYRRTQKPLFVDKMPNNFWHLGLIHLILPNAKIIDARRGAIACCFSNFKQLFGSGQEFTYSLETIARYYRCYTALMDHWEMAMPGRILRVCYENVVEDLEGNVRRILDFCGLEFEKQCTEFYKSTRDIRSASSEQVREPISRGGLEQWQNYRSWLGPLEEELGARPS